MTTPQHRVDDLAFDVPQGWTMSTILSAPSTSSTAFRSNVVMSTDRFRAQESFAAYVDRQIQEMAKNLRKFLLRSRSEVRVGVGDGREGIRIDCAWHGSQGPIEQAVVIVPREGGVVTLTASCPKNDWEAVRGAFDEMLGSLSIGGS